MKLGIFTLLALLCAAPVAWANDPTSQAKEPDHVTQLKWLDSADVDKMFQADIKAGIYRFYVTCGLSCQADGVGNIDAIQCYPIAKFKEIEGTADAIESEEDGLYQEKATHFALRYNIQLAEYLSKHNMTECVVGESWDTATQAMDKRLSEQDVTGDYVTAPYDNTTHKFRIALFLSAANQNQSIYSQICYLAVEYHLSGRLIVEIYNRADSAPLSSIECKYGQIYPSDWKPKPGDDEPAEVTFP
ncbi:MAG TPA: hypothetical protein VGM47_07330 [Gammaproteobacteria bacterium]|jgi:hypothetical protein